MTSDSDKGDKLAGFSERSAEATECNHNPSPELQETIWEQRPLAVSYKTAGSMIDRSSRTIARMVARGELVDLPGQFLITYKSLEDWVSRMSAGTN